MKKVFITGTDTDVGKTIVSAGLCMAWPAHYWKPIQAGYQVPKGGNAKRLSSANVPSSSSLTPPLPINAMPFSSTNVPNPSSELALNKILPGTDNEVINRFIPEQHIHPSVYTLKNPLSPNQAAKIEGVKIQKEKINYPRCSSNLVIEGAGGALVPFNKKEDMTDLMKKMDCPVIIVARSSLGTLNHTFLTLSVLRAKKIPIMGVIMVGPLHEKNKNDIETKGKVSVLLELPLLDTLSPETLRPYFEKMSFSID
ncbi:MAG: dethiobiotin synthase [Bdellovibrionales bacterium]|nr:dethiobiotin synthase [Bdellovibrionales bacterium]